MALPELAGISQRSTDRLAGLGGGKKSRERGERKGVDSMEVEGKEGNSTFSNTSPPLSRFYITE